MWELRSRLSAPQVRLRPPLPESRTADGESWTNWLTFPVGFGDVAWDVGNRRFGIAEAGCQVGEHMLELDERGGGESGHRVLGELAPRSLQLRDERPSRVAELDDGCT